MYDFLFNSSQNLTQNDWILFGVFGVLIVLGIVEIIFRKSVKNPVVKALHSRWIHVFFTIGILGAAWAGMRYLFVPYLGPRFTALLILLVGIAWSGFIVWYMVRNYAHAKAEWENKARKEKYLR